MSVNILQLTAEEELQNRITHLCERNTQPHVVFAINQCPDQKGSRLKLSLTTLGGTSFILEVSKDSEGPSLSPMTSLHHSSTATFSGRGESKMSSLLQSSTSGVSLGCGRGQLQKDFTPAEEHFC